MPGNSEGDAGVGEYPDQHRGDRHLPWRRDLVERGEANWALEKSLARLANEEGTRARLVGGELGVDFYGLRQKLEELGVEYVDTLDDVDGEVTA